MVPRAPEEQSDRRVGATAESPVVDVLVIGAGQAGLAVAWALRRAPLGLELVDRAERVGDSWRRRWDSLRLFSPRASSALPGLALPGEPDGYPTKDELADYLEAYARRLGVPVRTRTGVRRLSIAGGRFHAETERGDVLVARAVVLATGAFEEPIVPPSARRLSPHVLQLTAATYRSPAQLPPGRIVVVGDGATGRQIALELSDEREVLLATGRPRLVTPQRILGRDQLWWSDRLGLLRAARGSAVGRLLRRLDPFPGSHLTLRRLRRRGVTIVGRLREVGERRAVFEDRTTVELDAIVWAMGYRERSEWIDIPGAKDDAGRLVERRGVSPVPRLYRVGREWQWTRGSALLMGVARDATFVADRIIEELAVPAKVTLRGGSLVADAARASARDG
jgi:putative flavoprotein involved in K+ transport